MIMITFWWPKMVFLFNDLSKCYNSYEILTQIADPGFLVGGADHLGGSNIQIY